MFSLLVVRHSWFSQALLSLRTLGVFLPQRSCSHPFHKDYRQEKIIHFRPDFRGITRKSANAITRENSWGTNLRGITRANGNLGVALCNAGPLSTCSVVWCSAWDRSSNHKRTRGTDKGETEAERQSTRKLLFSFRMMICCFSWSGGVWTLNCLLCPHTYDIMGSPGASGRKT